VYVVAHNGAAIFGGGEKGTALLLQGLQRRGHRVLMLCRDREMAARIADLCAIPTGVAPIGGDAMLPHALRFAATLRRHRPDALILTTFKKVTLAGIGARLAGVPRVVQRIVLSTDVPRGARYRFAMRRLVDAVTLNAAAMREPFLARAPGLDPSRVVTLYDGVAVPERTAEPGAVRRTLNLPEGAFVIGALSRIARQKRFDRLMEALAMLPRHVHCVIAGEGTGVDALRAKAAEIGVADRLHLLGFRRDVGDVLSALDLFVVSSDSEGMANAMLEAMSLGIPIVSTPVSGAAEALDAFADGTAPGVVTAEFDARSLADAVSSVAGDAGRLREMGDAARRRISERFSYEAFLDRWEALLLHGPEALEAVP
jgi:glycosyltransferase involved in cell wall biosynthesis